MSDNHDQAFPQISVGGRILADVLDTNIPPVVGNEPRPIYRGGMVVKGHAKNSRANHLVPSFTISRPSKDTGFLEGLVLLTKDVPFTYVYTDTSEIPAGEIISVSGSGPIVRGGPITNGQDPGTVEYSVSLVGFVMKFKDLPDLIRS